MVVMFDLIHEFSVLGTACFMMALATVWYSPMLFGTRFMRESGVTQKMIDDKQPQMLKHMALTFVSYVGMLTVLALLGSVASVLGMAVWEIAALASLFIACALIPAVLFEGRSGVYYAIQAGFYVVFVMLGTLMIQYWPW